MSVDVDVARIDWRAILNKRRYFDALNFGINYPLGSIAAARRGYNSDERRRIRREGSGEGSKHCRRGG